MDKHAFWSRVRSGKERADTLAREVFCQAMLTCTSDSMYGCEDSETGTFRGKNSNDGKVATVGAAGGLCCGGVREEGVMATPAAGPGQGAAHGRAPTGDERDCCLAGDGGRQEAVAAGGGIVRLQSIMETTSSLVRRRVWVEIEIIVCVVP